MKCKNETCNNETKGKSKYCSDTCKTVYNRNKSQAATVTNATVTPAVTDRAYAYVDGGKVSNRQAVSFNNDSFETRPEPESIDDQPNTTNRHRYTRQDGSEYTFDACGKVFEVTNGKVYQSIEEVKECYSVGGGAWG